MQCSLWYWLSDDAVMKAVYLGTDGAGRRKEPWLSVMVTSTLGPVGLGGAKLISTQVFALCTTPLCPTQWMIRPARVKLKSSFNFRMPHSCWTILEPNEDLLSIVELQVEAEKSKFMLCILFNWAEAHVGWFLVGSVYAYDGGQCAHVYYFLKSQHLN